MSSRTFWIDAKTLGRLAIVTRPLGDELSEVAASWRREGISAVVSLLEESENKELGLEREAEACGEAGIYFASLPIPDRGLPNEKEFHVMTRDLSERLRRGENCAVHCRAGIGRSGMLVCCTLRALGMSASEALRVVSEARGLSVPDTEDQRRWIDNFNS